MHFLMVVLQTTAIVLTFMIVHLKSEYFFHATHINIWINYAVTFLMAHIMWKIDAKQRDNSGAGKITD